MLSMKFVLPAAGIAAILLAIVALAQRRGNQPSSLPTPRTEAERKIIDTLADVVRKGETYLNVPIEDGKALRLLAEAAGAKNVVEVGTSTGYSGLWLCLALRSTGGHLTTFELDHGRATQARAHFDEAGVGGLVTIVEGDAHQNLKRLHDPIDVAFIDAEKDGYVDYLNQILPLVRPGGLILAHNIGMAPEYMKSVTTNPELETIFYREGAGLGISLKKR